tara:strand:- start:206 stop:2155 length:1950 start_codon:yes stop_codon:yes gene_type:complete
MATLTGTTIAGTYKSLLKATSAVPALVTGSTTERLVFGEDDAADVRTNLYVSQDRLGIGTSTPTYALDVETSDEIVASFVSTDDKALIQISDNNTNGYILVSDNNMQFGGQADHNANSLVIKTNGAGVGIGTLSPAVGTSSSGYLDIENATTSSATQGATLRLGSNDGAVMASGHRLGAIEFCGAEDASNTMSIGASIQAFANTEFGGSTNTSYLQFFTVSGTTHTPKMTISNTGNVGIGNTSPNVSTNSAPDTILTIGAGVTAGDEGIIELVGSSDDAVSGAALGAIQFCDTSNVTDHINVAMIAGRTDTGHSTQSGGRIDFMTKGDASTTFKTAITIDDNANVGIGTNAPYSPLHIVSAAEGVIADGSSNIPQVLIEGSGTTAGSSAPTLCLHNSSTAVDNDYIGFISFTGGDSGDSSPANPSEGTEYANISVRVLDETDASTDGIMYIATDVADTTTNTLYITGGYLGVGIQPGAPLHVEKEMADDGVLAKFVYNTADDAVDADDTIMHLQFGDDNSEVGVPFFMTFNDSDSVCGSITWDDDNSVLFNESSDYRIKSNIKLIDSSLANINKLKPSSFNIKKATKKANGFIAHELQEVYPFMVTGKKDAVDKDGNMIVQQVAGSKLIPFLVKAIQELSAKVTALENA